MSRFKVKTNLVSFVLNFKKQLKSEKFLFFLYYCLDSLKTFNICLVISKGVNYERVTSIQSGIVGVFVNELKFLSEEWKMICHENMKIDLKICTDEVLKCMSLTHDVLSK